MARFMHSLFGVYARSLVILGKVLEVYGGVIVKHGEKEDAWTVVLKCTSKLCELSQGHA